MPAGGILLAGLWVLLWWVAGSGGRIRSARRIGVWAALRVRIPATRLVGVLAALRLVAPISALSIRIRSVGVLAVRTAGRNRHRITFTFTDHLPRGSRATTSPIMCVTP